MQTMRLLFVEDQKADVSDVKRLLASTGLFSVELKLSYAELGGSTDELLENVAPYDLLVLDVFMQGRNPQPFFDFVDRIGGNKPFMAYTRLVGSDELQIGDDPDRWEEIARIVFENGGMALVSKSPFQYRTSHRHSKTDQEYELVERIVTFYWSVVSSGSESQQGEV